MTYAEIIKHLEVYSDGISGMHEDFDPGLQETCVNAIDFINRQKAEIETSQKAIKVLEIMNDNQKAEIERLKANEEMAEGYADALVEYTKAEAYKEFAEEVNKELFGEEYQLDKAHRRAVERVLNRLTSKE